MTDRAHDSAVEIGLPSRRTLVATIAAAPALAFPAFAQAKSRLADLIEAHRSAAAAYLAAVEAEEAIEDLRDTDFLEIALRQGRIQVEPDKIGRAVVEKQIRDSYRGARIFAGDAHRVLRDDRIFAAQSAALDAAEAADLASVAAAYEAWPAGRAIAKAAERTGRASNEEDAAMLAICSYRCSTVADARSKAAYLLGPGAWTKDEPLHDHVIALLRSFVGEGVTDV